MADDRARPRGLLPQMRTVAADLEEPLDRYQTVAAASASLRSALRNRYVLLVLDDVWNARDVDPFRIDSSRCRILFTTRNARIVVALGAHEYSLNVLTLEQSAMLLSRWSGASANTLPPVAYDVIDACGHLPLALAMIGARIRGKPERWSNILHKLRNADIARIEQEFPHYPYKSLLVAMAVSVDSLDEQTRERYLELSIFPNDARIPEESLQVYWGLSRFEVEDLTDLYVDFSLATRDDNRCIMLHDIQMDYVRHMTEAGCLQRMHARLLGNYGSRTDTYIVRAMAHHLLGAGRREHLKALLCTSSWLLEKLKLTDYSSLLSDYRLFPQEQTIQLIRAALARLSQIRASFSHVVGRASGVGAL